MTFTRVCAGQRGAASRSRLRLGASEDKQTGGAELVAGSYDQTPPAGTKRQSRDRPVVMYERTSGVHPHPYLASRSPIAFAHRGGSAEAPENTMVAFEAAIGLGFRYLELDVHLTRDDTLVVHHDDSLDRTTDRSGAIAQLPMEAIDAADAGYAYSPDGGTTFPLRGQGVTVPRLEHVLKRWPRCRFNIDPKSNLSVLPLVQLITRLNAWHRVAVASFSDRRLRTVRQAAGGKACTAMGRRAVVIAGLCARSGWMPRQGADCAQVPLSRDSWLDMRAFIKAAHRRKLPVHAWTVNDEETMNRLLDLGIDGIMTDRPRLLATVFADRGLALAED